jgi:hypothetical protein
MVICAPISDLPGIGFFVCAFGRESTPDLVPVSEPIDVSAPVLNSNRGAATLAAVAWLRRPFRGDPLLSDCIFNGPSERAMHSCLNARYQSEGMWRPANLVAAANWQNNFEFSNKNNDCTNHCGQQSKQRHQDGSQGPHRSGSCGDFEAALNVGPQFGSTLRSPTRATRRLGERTTAVYVEPPRPPRSAATEKPFGSLFTPSGAPPVGPGRPGPDLTAGGALPMFRSRQARLIPLRFGRVRRQPIGFT